MIDWDEWESVSNTEGDLFYHKPCAGEREDDDDWWDYVECASRSERVENHEKDPRLIKIAIVYTCRACLASTGETILESRRAYETALTSQQLTVTSGGGGGGTFYPYYDDRSSLTNWSATSTIPLLINYPTPPLLTTLTIP